LSVVVLTLNEEENIERCLGSINDVADEIIVVDSFSTDKTEEICRRFPVRFIKHPFEGFIEQKNFAMSQTTHPYVLSIEGDEALSEDLKKSIFETKKNWTHDAYDFNRHSNYCGQWINHCGWYPDKKTRLWDRRKGRFGGSNPHDTLIMDEGSTKKHLKGDLLHFAFTSISEHVALANKYSDIKAEAAFAKGQRGSLFSTVFRPLFQFVKDYIFYLGFLDGFYGFVICSVSAYSKFLKYAKLRQISKF
jgi:glycosyltransferase involved in cell wall biosynthesis